MTVTTRFLANCRVLEDSSETWGKPMMHKLRPNFFMNGRFGICQIEILSGNEIEAGGTGRIRVIAEIFPQDRDDLEPGKGFELRNGTNIKWATCEIEEIEEVNEFEGKYK